MSREKSSIKEIDAVLKKTDSKADQIVKLVELAVSKEDDETLIEAINETIDKIDGNMRQIEQACRIITESERGREMIKKALYIIGRLRDEDEICDYLRIILEDGYSLDDDEELAELFFKNASRITYDTYRVRVALSFIRHSKSRKYIYRAFDIGVRDSRDRYIEELRLEQSSRLSKLRSWS